MKPWPALVALGLAAACRDGAAPDGTIRVIVTRPQLAPVELSVPAHARPCFGEPGRVILGAADLQGILIWVVTGTGPDTGAFTVNRGVDSVPGRHARVSLRYLAGDMAHSLALDSGTVRVRRDGATFAGSLTASGYDATEAGRALVEATLRGIPLLPDSEPCMGSGTP